MGGATQTFWQLLTAEMSSWFVPVRIPHILITPHILINIAHTWVTGGDTGILVTTSSRNIKLVRTCVQPSSINNPSYVNKHHTHIRTCVQASSAGNACCQYACVAPPITFVYVIVCVMFINVCVCVVYPSHVSEYRAPLTYVCHLCVCVSV